MVLRWSLVLLAVVVGFGAAIARADHAPAIAIPGNPDVPVIINGRNATGAIVIGDWGLYRPGHVPPTVIYRQPWPKPCYRCPSATVPHCRCKRARPVRRRIILKSGRRHFYPGGTVPPKLGRLEHDVPASPPPVPAESYSRTWSTRSSPAPATIGRPPVIVAPAIVGNRFRPRPRRPRPRP